MPGKVRPGDYRQATGMMLPYPGAWELPPNGLVVYDWYAGRGQKLESEYAFELKGWTNPIENVCLGNSNPVGAKHDPARIRLIEKEKVKSMKRGQEEK